MGDPDETLAVVVARLDDLRQNVDGLRSELRDRDARYVSRAEWEMWREAVTASLGEARRGRDDLAKRMDAKHVPWTGVAAVVISAVALAWTVVQTL